MAYQFNTFKSITKGLMVPNIIFPAAYILFSAKGCFDFSPSPSFLSEPNPVNQTKGPEDLNEAKGEALGVKSLLGRGTLLNLDGYQCGLFIASETKAAFIIKLPLEGGWAGSFERGQQGEQGRQTDLLSVQYDAVEDPRIIKVDGRLFNLLLGQSSDSSFDQAGFWPKIEEDDAWYDIEFFYTEPIGNSPIFTENGIRPSTEFTKVLHKKFSSTNSLISSRLSITGKVASTTLKSFEKVGFLLVKDKSGLVHLVKNMLEGGAEWATKTEVAVTKDYITCPAAFSGDALAFDSSDLKLKLQDSSLRLEDYRTTFCYFKDGEYERLVALENIVPDVKIEQEACPEIEYYWPPEEKILKKSTPAIPSEQLVNKDETESKDSKDAHPNVNNKQTVPKGDLINFTPKPVPSPLLPKPNTKVLFKDIEDQLPPPPLTSNEPGNSISSLRDSQSSQNPEHEYHTQDMDSINKKKYALKKTYIPEADHSEMSIDEKAAHHKKTKKLEESALEKLNRALRKRKELFYPDEDDEDDIAPQNRQPASNGSENGSIPPPMPSTSGSVGSPPPPPMLVPEFCSNINASNQGSGQLLDQIRQDTNLKKFEPDSKPENPRNALMADLRSCKKADYNEISVDERVAAYKKQAAKEQLQKTTEKNKTQVTLQSIITSSEFQARVTANQTNSEDEDDNDNDKNDNEDDNWSDDE